MIIRRDDFTFSHSNQKKEQGTILKSQYSIAIRKVKKRKEKSQMFQTKQVQ